MTENVNVQFTNLLEFIPEEFENDPIEQVVQRVAPETIVSHSHVC